jgi:hypothetical protein
MIGAVLFFFRPVNIRFIIILNYFKQKITYKQNVHLFLPSQFLKKGTVSSDIWALLFPAGPDSCF